MNTTRATGTFEVQLASLTPYNTDDPTLGRRSIDKQFHGGLEATSKGEMLSAATSGYVAIERVTGSLDGRTGTFTLQHSATMNRGVPTLSVSVVPDSGTGELAGLTGTMMIIISGGKHAYEFDYVLSVRG
jgi:hypothetical protein